jgi:hypothetical protein
VSDQLRTELLLPVAGAYYGSLDWDEALQRAVVERQIVLTTSRLLAKLPDNPSSKACEQANTLAEAKKAVVGLIPRGCDHVYVVREIILDAIHRFFNYTPAQASKTLSDAFIRLTTRIGMQCPQVDDLFKMACQIWLDAAIDGALAYQPAELNSAPV